MRINTRNLFLVVFVGSLFCVPFYGHADTLGQRETFNVDPDFDKYGRTNIGATLRQVGGKAYFYVEDSYWNSLGASQQSSLSANLISLSNDFDNVIYPREISFWGSEPNPGIDGDSKMTILLEDVTRGNGGYFDSSNGYTRQSAPESNQREMIALNAEVLTSSFDLAKDFLAHEFQHIISFNQKNLIRNIYESVWLNELRSEYSVSLVGYNDIYQNSNLERRVRTFLENSSDSLTEWPNKSPDYGIVAVFAEYLKEQFEGDILRDTIKSFLIGIDSINQYLQGSGRYERFSDVFINWMGAVYLNDYLVDSRLGFKRNELKNIRVQPQQRIFLSNSLQEYSSVRALKDWQPAWLEYDFSSFSGDLSKSLKLNLEDSADQKYLVSYLAFYNQKPVQMGRVEIVNGRGSTYILNSDKRLSKVVVLATKGTKITDFTTSETPYPLSVNVSVVETNSAEANIIKDGALIKNRGGGEIYVIWGKYKRYLTPGVIALYGHLNPANVIEVEPEVFFSYTTSNYVKYVNDEKVYAVWPDETKHWLNITPQQWDASGRDWGAIFTINDLELNYYRTGVEITR